MEVGLLLVYTFAHYSHSNSASVSTALSCLSGGYPCVLSTLRAAFLIPALKLSLIVQSMVAFFSDRRHQFLADGMEGLVYQHAHGAVVSLLILLVLQRRF